MSTLAERIAHGKTKLLGAEEICERIGVSRTTFDRWVRNGGGKIQGSASIASTLVSQALGKGVHGLFDPIENATDGGMTFPAPDIRIGNSPKWELDTLIKWLNTNIKKG